MADRGRDLKFSILSDLSQFDTDKPAKGLEDLSDAATAAGRSVDTFERDARNTARKVDDAFDGIARSSKRNIREKVPDDLHHAAKGLDDFKEEAHQSGREAAASFGGGFDDIGSFIQETAANAFGGFGPLGTAAGIAAAAGIGLITKAFGDSQQRAEELKQATQDFFQAFVDGAGKLSKATIEGKLQDLIGDPDQFKELREQADAAGISVTTYARALSGSIPDQQKVNEQLAVNRDRLSGTVAANIDAKNALEHQRTALGKVAERLGQTTGTINDAHSAWSTLDQATREGITADVDVRAPTAKELANEHAEMQRHLGRPVNVPVTVSTTRAARLAQAELQAYFDRHPVTLRTRTGTRPIRDIP